jgi:hypothetical protein
MKIKWESKGLYEHPAKHLAGNMGQVVLSEAGVYQLRQGIIHIACPTSWAAKIHAAELKSEEKSRVMVRLPENVKRLFLAKLASEGKKAQEVLETFVIEYIGDPENKEVD